MITPSTICKQTTAIVKNPSKATSTQTFTAVTEEAAYRLLKFRLVLVMRGFCITVAYNVIASIEGLNRRQYIDSVP